MRRHFVDLQLRRRQRPTQPLQLGTPPAEIPGNLSKGTNARNPAMAHAALHAAETSDAVAMLSS